MQLMKILSLLFHVDIIIKSEQKQRDEWVSLRSTQSCAKTLPSEIPYKINGVASVRATVSALTRTNRLAQPGHVSRSATQKARSVSPSVGRGRSFMSAVTCCRRAQAPSETRKLTIRNIAVKFAGAVP